MSRRASEAHPAYTWVESSTGGSKMTAFDKRDPVGKAEGSGVHDVVGERTRTQNSFFQLHGYGFNQTGARVPIRAWNCV